MEWMPLTKILRISDELFQGYEMMVDLHTMSSVEEMCLHVKTNLMATLLFYNMERLAEQLEPKNFHIHTIEAPTWAEFVTKVADQMGGDDVIWICSGCENE